MAGVTYQDLPERQGIAEVSTADFRVAVEAAVGSMMEAGKLDDSKLLEEETDDD